jgi:uncharacterized phage protein (TIGR02218 family)
MKPIPIALQADYDSGSASLAIALRITRTDGEVYGFTGADEDVVIDGVAYDASQGLDGTNLMTSAGLEVDNAELTTLDDGSLFSRVDVLSGIWQNSEFLFFRYNFVAPTDGIEPIIAGTIGQVRLLRGKIVCELRGLQQYLQQPVGSVTSKTCRARFCDFPKPNGSNRCRLSPIDWTEGLTVTAVTAGSRRTFASAGSARPDDWYAEGIITWDSGPNAGLMFKVKAFADQTFELLTDTPYPVDIGHAFTALAGCRKRLAEDCRDRFDNVPNFSGEPHLPGIDELSKTPDPVAS